MEKNYMRPPLQRLSRSRNNLEQVDSSLNDRDAVSKDSPLRSRSMRRIIKDNYGPKQSDDEKSWKSRSTRKLIPGLSDVKLLLKTGEEVFSTYRKAVSECSSPQSEPVGFGMRKRQARKRPESIRTVQAFAYLLIAASVASLLVGMLYVSTVKSSTSSAEEFTQPEKRAVMDSEAKQAAEIAAAADDVSTNSMLHSLARRENAPQAEKFDSDSVHFPEDALLRNSNSKQTSFPNNRPAAKRPDEVDKNVMETTCVNPFYIPHSLEVYRQYANDGLRKFSPCRVPLPKGYKVPLEWPARLDQVWSSNVPNTSRMFRAKQDQRWFSVKDDMLDFVDGGGSFGGSSKQYVQKILSYTKKEDIHNVLDMGAGVGNVAAAFLREIPDVKVLSFSEDTGLLLGQSNIVSERGLPSLSWTMGEFQFPAPSGSFDVVHCSWCWIWNRIKPKGRLHGLERWFLEIDRLLRVGGYFVWHGSWSTDCRAHTAKDSSKPVCFYSNEITSVASRLGWKVLRCCEWTVATMIFQKPACELPQPGVEPTCGKKCGAAYGKCEDHEQLPTTTSFARPIQSCQSCEYANKPHYGQRTQELLSRAGLGKEALKQEWLAWWPLAETIADLPDVKTGRLRNILHVDCGFGSLAAALKQVLESRKRQAEIAKAVKLATSGSPVPPPDLATASQPFVLNVSPEQSPLAYTLPIVSDRKLLGLHHNWCDPFPAFPRSFDILVIDKVATWSKSECSLSWIFLEWDRLIRPGGLIFISSDVLSAPASPHVDVAPTMDDSSRDVTPPTNEKAEGAGVPTSEMRPPMTNGQAAPTTNENGAVVTKGQAAAVSAASTTNGEVAPATENQGQAPKAPQSNVDRAPTTNGPAPIISTNEIRASAPGTNPKESQATNGEPAEAANDSQASETGAKNSLVIGQKQAEPLVGSRDREEGEVIPGRVGVTSRLLLGRDVTRTVGDIVGDLGWVRVRDVPAGKTSAEFVIYTKTGVSVAAAGH